MTRSVTNTMAIIAGMKLSDRGSGMLANGATAPNAASVTTMTTNASWRCRSVGGNVAIEYSNSSLALRSDKTSLPEVSLSLSVSRCCQHSSRLRASGAAHYQNVITLAKILRALPVCGV